MPFPSWTNPKQLKEYDDYKALDAPQSAVKDKYKERRKEKMEKTMAAGRSNDLITKETQLTPKRHEKLMKPALDWENASRA